MKMVKAYIKFTYIPELFLKILLFYSDAKGTEWNKESVRERVRIVWWKKTTTKQQQRLGFIWCTMAIQRNHRQILWHSFGFSLALCAFFSLSSLSSDAHSNTFTPIHKQQQQKAYTNSCVTWVPMKQWFLVCKPTKHWFGQERRRQQHHRTTTNNWDANKKICHHFETFKCFWAV